MVAWGPWLPDQPDYRGPSLVEALNVVPREDGFYGPLPSLVTTSSALPGRGYGMVSVRNTTGTVISVAGTAAGLFRAETSGAWADVSKSGGYSLEVDNGERHRFATFGDRLIVACGIGDNLQSFDLVSGTQFGDLSADAPRAHHLSIVRDFVMVGSTWTEADGAIPHQIWWSAINNPTSWPAPGSALATTVQSDSQIMPDGGYIQGILAGIGGSDAAIFGESRIWRASYEGPPTIFRFDAVERSRGVYAPGSLIGVGRMAYYFAEDGWYAFDGVASTPIGAGKIDRWFVADFDDSFRDNVWAAADTERRVIFWAYPGAGNIGGVPNRLLMFNWITGQWARGEMTVDCFGGMTGIGYTLEGLDALGYTLETLPFSLDSRIWTGGGAFVGAIDGTGHRLGQLAGPPLQADLTAAAFSGQNGSRFFLQNSRIYTDCPTCQGAILTQDSLSGDEADTGFLTQDEDQIPHLACGRYGKLKGRMPAGASWTQTQGYEISMRPEGRR